MERMLIPEDTHEARVVLVANVGTLKKTYKGKDSFKKTIMLSFEFSEVERKTIDGNFKMVISQQYSFFLGERAKLRKHIEAIIGRKLTAEETDYSNKSSMFRVTGLLGKPCFITTTNKPWEKNGKSGINTLISNVSTIPAKYIDQVPPAQRKLMSFDIRRFSSLAELEGDSTYKLLNKFVKTKIHQSKEYLNLKKKSPSTTEGFTNQLF